MEFNKFNLISCRNVLHHLPAHMEGLKTLSLALEEGGCMMLELYGKYGREQSGTTRMRKALHLINGETNDWETKIKNAKILLKGLGNLNPTNSMQQGDAFTMGDAGIVDHLLNPIEKCFTVPEIYDMIDEIDLNFVSWFGDYYSIYEAKLEDINIKGLEINNTNKRNFKTIIY